MRDEPSTGHRALHTLSTPSPARFKICFSCTRPCKEDTSTALLSFPSTCSSQSLLWMKKGKNSTALPLSPAQAKLLPSPALSSDPLTACCSCKPPWGGLRGCGILSRFADLPTRRSRLHTRANQGTAPGSRTPGQPSPTTHPVPSSRGMPGAWAAHAAQPALLLLLWGRVAAVRQNVLIGKLMSHLPKPITQLCCLAATASLLCQYSQEEHRTKGLGALLASQ